MNIRSLSAIAFGLTLTVAACAQDATTAAPPAQSQSEQAQGGRGQEGQGQRGGGRGWGGGMGRGLMGTVTEVAADHYTIKTDTGETYAIHYSANTRILKQQARSEGGSQRAGGQGGPDGGSGSPPQAIKSTDIRVGDAVAAMGEVDATAKSVGATMVMQIDPARAKQMREMQANYGKTWLMGKVTAIDGVKVTLMGNVDNTSHSFVADENTTFRKRRDPITLADIQVGDIVRVEGAVKEGSFVATAVNAMGPPPEGAAGAPRNAPPQ
jgi:hypothetical protein